MVLRVILQAGTDGGGRWAGIDGKPYLGIPKHKLRIDGEPIIDRTVRQLLERGCEVTIVAKNDPNYVFPGTTRWMPSGYTAADNQVSAWALTRPMWNPAGPTALLYGDVRWTDEAITKVTGFNGPDDWQMFYRPGRSSVNGCGHGEGFAHWWAASQHQRLAEALDHVVGMYRAGTLPWRNTCGWPVYRRMLGLPEDQLDGYSTPNHDHATVIDDWTDDIDTPLEYVTWYGRWAQGRYPARTEFEGTPESTRRWWPDTDPAGPKAIVRVDGDLRINPDQVWCGIAHAVEHNTVVVPYSHAYPFSKKNWQFEPMWTGHPASRRITITPTAPGHTTEPVRLYGVAWEMDR
jgi:hypothetical protein